MDVNVLLSLKQLVKSARDMAITHDCFTLRSHRKTLININFGMRLCPRGKEDHLTAPLFNFHA